MFPESCLDYSFIGKLKLTILNNENIIKSKNGNKKIRKKKKR